MTFLTLFAFQIILRIDPGEGHGHHKHVKTAGTASKFGIALDDLTECAKLCKANNITGEGLV